MLPDTTAAMSERMSANRLGRHHHVEVLGPAYEVHADTVHQQRLTLHLGVFGGDFFEDLVPEDHAEGLGVGLGDRGDFHSLVAADTVLKGCSDDALGAATGEDVALDNRLVRRT